MGTDLRQRFGMSFSDRIWENTPEEPSTPLVAPPDPSSPHTPRSIQPACTSTPGSAFSTSSASTTISDFAPPTPDVSGQWYIDNMDSLDDKVIESQTACDVLPVSKLNRQPGRRLQWMGRILMEALRWRRQ
ncbi:hypothetical protein Dda_6367 [Drechslerella dactyloides]|uniref:Uncharacterized protein n=1 Tax=Drechslerella dactyloides TaxID=74499 RepID=A0AAD6IXQ1_DREDA|nr:hypothetical protein Dda_6367 [Drechslerella dactyloides]